MNNIIFTICTMIRVYHSKFDCRSTTRVVVGVQKYMCIKAATRAARKKGVPNYKLGMDQTQSGMHSRRPYDEGWIYRMFHALFTV
jgi:hypothetical protein